LKHSWLKLIVLRIRRPKREIKLLDFPNYILGMKDKPLNNYNFFRENKREKLANKEKFR
jgi:hypothetical protein